MFRLGSSVARPTLLRIHEIAAGNPFFALELAREIGARRRITEFSLPNSLGDLVSSRLGRVGDGAEDALLAMASLPNPTIQLVAQPPNPRRTASSTCSVMPNHRRWWLSTETACTSRIRAGPWGVQRSDTAPTP